MPSRYGATGASLAPRKPAALFLPLAGIFAGPLNPAASFSYEYWSRFMYMDGLTASTWIMFQVVPMTIAVAITLSYLRPGADGLLSIVMTLIVGLIAAASAWAISVAALDWLLYSLGLQFTNYPVGSLGDFALAAGTGVRLNLLMNLASLITAALVIRAIGFQREK